MSESSSALHSGTWTEVRFTLEHVTGNMGILIRQRLGLGRLKSIHVHLSHGSSCSLVAYTCTMVYFFMGHTAIFLLVGNH